MAKPKDECIVPGCKKKRKWRGVCYGCYFAAKRQIEAGVATDADLVRKKLWLRSQRIGRPLKNKLAKLVGAK